MFAIFEPKFPLFHPFPELFHGFHFYFHFFFLNFSNIYFLLFFFKDYLGVTRNPFQKLLNNILQSNIRDQNLRLNCFSSQWVGLIAPGKPFLNCFPLKCMAIDRNDWVIHDFLKDRTEIIIGNLLFLFHSQINIYIIFIIKI